jgi:hypothetical protein
MRALFLGTVAVVVSASFARANDLMANYYGNTIIAKTSASEFHFHYRADHTFDGSGHGPNGPLALQGKWFLDDRGQLCRNYDMPPPGTSNPVCTPWLSHSVGDTWTLKEGVAATLVQGVQ